MPVIKGIELTAYGGMFYVLAAIILVATALAITRRNLIHAVACLVISFLGTALLFYLLGAPVLAAFEVILYAGAIMVLFLFVVITLHPGKQKPYARFFGSWVFPVHVGIIVLGLSAILLFGNTGSFFDLDAAMASPGTFGFFVYHRYWFAVEVASFLLFVALVGAFSLSKKTNRAKKVDR